MQTHPDMGHRIVSRLPGMDLAADIVRCYEERFDGTGYPQGLKGQAIPFGARLFAVIDTLDAMTSDRPYRQGLTFGAARDGIVGWPRSGSIPSSSGRFLPKSGPCAI